MNKGYKITIADSFIRKNGLFDNIAGDRLKLVKIDIRETEVMTKLVRENDIVFHLAAVSMVTPSLKDPLTTFQTNVAATEHIARICSLEKKRIIFSSSREVYGNAHTMPVSESQPFSPESPYGASKAAAEDILVGYSRAFGLDYVSLRLANIFGSGDFDRVIPIFLNKMIKGERVSVFGKDKVVDFIDVDTTCKVFEAGLNIPPGAYNVCSGKGTSIATLARRLKEITNSTSQIEIAENRPNEVLRFVGDPSKIRRITNLKTKVDIYDYIRRRMLSEM